MNKLRGLAMGVVAALALVAGPPGTPAAAAGGTPGDPPLPSYPGLPPASSSASLAAVSTTPLPCDDNGHDDLSLTRDQVLSRARTWLNVGGVPYSQYACYRNSLGDYRTDCSGFVSMAWGLGGRGDAFWTGNLDERSYVIARSSLQPGDALLRHTGDKDENHVALFVKWSNSAHTEPVVIEQTGSAGTIERTWSSGNAGLYTPVRYDNILDGNYDSFDGDARADMIVHSGTDVSVRLNTGSAWDGGRSVSSGWGRFHGMDVPDGMGRLYFADFNGDHRTDMIVHGGTDVSVRLNTGGGFDGGRTVSSGWGRYHGLQVPDGLGRLYFADFNGDGRADMFVHSGTDLSVRLNTGSGFDGGRSVSSGWGRYHGMQIPNGLGRLYFADFNGDGRADMFVHGGTDLSVRLNTGSGFDGGRSVSSGWGRYHGLQVPDGLGRLYFADFNGDHRADLIVHSGTDISVRLNTGSGFDGGRSVSSGWGRYFGLQVPDGLGRLYFAS
ncbi:FG-GAP-like repeat-containing protein [Actinoplanes sp. CA-030573]|uniref:C40 family peptidase n=1 Tax=Actinoplanes sp. CA-030573 TaxID=3239898 RepID=UPI003D922C1D